MSHTKKLKWATVAAMAALVLSACGQQQSLNSEMSSLENSNIVGGEAVKASEGFAKSTVALATVRFGVFCTGSLIAENLVVTAAHCADVAKEMAPGDKMVVIFSRSLEVEKLPAAYVTNIVQHSDWTTRNNEEKDSGDIALIKFAGKLPAGYEPATLLTDSSLLENGAEVILAGYGVLGMLPQVEAKELMKASVLLTDKDYSNTEVKFEQHEGRGACHGDSGGPAYTKVDGKWVLFGVTSRSATLKGGATCLEGSIYMNLATQTDFIKEASEFLNAPAKEDKEKTEPGLVAQK